MDPSQSTSPDASGTGAIRVLILDDDEAFRDVMVRSLRSFGVSADTAINGQLGLKRLLAESYDVILMDHGMARMDGMTFIEEARKLWPWLTIILCTGYDDEDLTRRASEQNVHVFKKPVNCLEVARYIIQVAEEQRSSPVDPEGRPPERTQHQLTILRHLSEAALSGQNLPDALRQLCTGLSHLVECDMAGVLVEGEKAMLMEVRVLNPQPGEWVDQFQEGIIARFEALSGRSLQGEHLLRDVDGDVTDAPSSTRPETVMVPIIHGESMLGMISLSLREGCSASSQDIAFIYHAANHLATLLIALNQARDLINRDALTGFYNRRTLKEVMTTMFNLARREAHTMAILMLDIDIFKGVNDRLGHQVGDMVLREFANRLRSVVRASEPVFRMGGDEFLVVLGRADRVEAEILAERMNECFRRAPIEVGEEQIHLSVSIGLAVNEPDHPFPSIKAFLRTADHAMYQAKNHGRDGLMVQTSHLLPAKGDSFLQDGANSRVQNQDPEEEGDVRVLIVDDDDLLLKYLTKLLSKEGYDVLVADTVEHGLERLRDATPNVDILITDIHLENRDGFDMLASAQEIDPELVCLVISGYVTADNAILAMRTGAYDFVEKPVSRPELLSTLARAVKFRRLTQENKHYKLYLEDMVQQKSKEVASSLSQLEKAYEFTLESMVAMLDAREYEVSRHSIRVMELTHAVCEKMNVREPELSQYTRGALLHDIGKIAIPDHILLKDGRLTDDEWEEMKRHPEIGYDFIRTSEFLQTEAEIVLYHHERFDGGGYPHGLQGEDIPLGARIFSVIDAYDAMRSARTYKDSWPKKKALGEILKERGSQFDPAVVDAFVNMQDQIEHIGGWSHDVAPERDTEILLPPG